MASGRFPWAEGEERSRVRGSSEQRVVRLRDLVDTSTVRKHPDLAGRALTGDESDLARGGLGRSVDQDRLYAGRRPAFDRVLGEGYRQPHTGSVHGEDGGARSLDGTDDPVAGFHFHPAYHAGGASRHRPELGTGLDAQDLAARLGDKDLVVLAMRHHGHDAVAIGHAAGQDPACSGVGDCLGR